MLEWLWRAPVREAPPLSSSPSSLSIDGQSQAAGQELPVRQSDMSLSAGGQAVSHIMHLRATGWFCPPLSSGPYHTSCNFGWQGGRVRWCLPDWQTKAAQADSA